MFFYGDVDDSLGYTMNREHIWCKADASFYQLGGGCDLHHLRPSINFVNSAKSYYPFGYVQGNRNVFIDYPDNGKSEHFRVPRRGQMYLVT